MRIRRACRAAPWHVGLASAVAVGGLLLAAPAVGLVGSDPSGQPPPGAPAVEVDEVEPIPAQPPADASAHEVRPGQVAPVPAQPANPDPQPAGPSAQVTGPQEPSSPPVDDAGRADGGGDGSDHLGGRAD